MTMLWETHDDGFFRNKRNGKCLDVWGTPGVTVGSRLAINQCQDKSIDASALWTVMQRGFIRNIGNDEGSQYQCIQVSGEPWDNNVKDAAGTPLVVTP